MQVELFVERQTGQAGALAALQLHEQGLPCRTQANLTSTAYSDG
jgi:hypothetical protein